MTEPECAGAPAALPLLMRMLAFPADVVFEAWIDPDQVARWWGPVGFETPRDTVTIEARVGGRYDLCMIDSVSGERFWVRNEIRDVAAGSLLVPESEPMPEFGRSAPVITTIRFQNESGATRLTLDREYPPERREPARAGWSSSLDKLEALLGRWRHSRRRLRAERPDRPP